jgi:hypothetical protein
MTTDFITTRPDFDRTTDWKMRVTITAQHQHRPDKNLTKNSPAPQKSFIFIELKRTGSNLIVL